MGSKPRPLIEIYVIGCVSNKSTSLAYNYIYLFGKRDFENVENDLALHTAFTICYNKMKTTNEMRIIADGTFESAKIEIIGVS